MIQRIIYVPTLRCNCKCTHCGQHQFMEQECSPQLIYQRLSESKIAIGSLSITGGEPFLKGGLAEAIANIVDQCNLTVDFTTNGTCRSEIEELVSIVDKKENLMFSVSIDGLPEIHDAIRKYPNAFNEAIKTVVYLRENGISVKINTVIQKLNYEILDQFEQSIKEHVGSEVPISWIPQIADISREEEFPYDDEQIAEIKKRTPSYVDHAYLNTKGVIKIASCHAGNDSILIAPSGEVYTCLTAFSYKNTNTKNNYLIGDLKIQTLDEIYEIMKSADANYKKYVKCCEGCWNPCEVSNEINYYGLDLNHLIEQVESGELKRVSVLKFCERLEMDLQWMHKSMQNMKRKSNELYTYSDVGENIPVNQKQNILLQKLIYFAKRVVKKMNRFLIEDQKVYNNQSAEILDNMIVITDQMATSIAGINEILKEMQDNKRNEEK